MQKPKRKKNRALLIILGIIAVILLFLLALFALLWINRSAQANKDFNSRPLVLIHAPLNHETVQAGEIVTVHATARQDKGVARMELWVDEIRLAEHTTADGQPSSSLILSESWIPTVAGSHVIIVRAFAPNGVSGQATVIVEAVQQGERTGIYPVEEGDTLAGIADAVGSTPEELTELNPDLGGSEPSPGDELEVPEPDYSGEDAGDGASGMEGEEPDEEAEEDEGVIPAPEDDPPGGEGPFPDMGSDEIGFTGEPVGLRVEVVRLRSSPTTERLYCYVHLGLQPTVRYPDEDGDPTTDETFTPLTAAIGDDFWDTEPYLVGSAAPVVYWPDEEDLPFEVTCTGIASGGTDALDMGTFDIDVPPANWDGVLRDQTAIGAEGAYFVAYRISRVNNLRDVPLYQDAHMTPPTNVAINDVTNTLSWDYLPGEYEEPITGFRVYLNNTLQWVEGAGARQSELPPEWLHPPCGTTYTYGVTAYRFDLPDGPESPPGETFISSPTEEEGCRQQIEINFLALETYDLGDDGNHERRSGDVGPPYGEFFANAWLATFNARAGEGWGGRLDTPLGLTHNTVYYLAEIATDPSWRFSMQPSTVVSLAEGESLRFGFNIKDEDTGICHDSDDPGCDDNVCNGVITVNDGLDLPHEGSILSTNGRCRVTYNYGPAAGSPAGGGAAAGEVPLPWIEVEKVKYSETTNTITTFVHNSGSAALAGQHLEIGYEYRNGTPIGVEYWGNTDLAPGGRNGLSTSNFSVEPPYDICVTVDPNDAILEYYEANGTRTHTRYCPLQPDLVINDVAYDAAGGGRLRVTVGNIGDTSLDYRILTLRGYLPDGSSASLFSSWPDVKILPYESRVFEISGISEGMRSMLEENGYRIVVDPDNTIAEMNDENNTYNITTTRLKVWSCSSCIPEHYSGGIWKWDSMDIFVNKVRGDVSEEMYYVRREEYSAWDGTPHIWHLGCDSGLTCDTGSRVFSILEDEVLNVTVDVSQGYVAYHRDYGSVTRNFTVDNSWGGFPAADENDWNHRPYCQFISYTPEGEDENWWTTLCILQLP